MPRWWLRLPCPGCRRKRTADPATATITIWPGNLIRVQYPCPRCRATVSGTVPLNQLAELRSTQARIVDLAGEAELDDPHRRDPRPLTYGDLRSLHDSLKEG